jgi:hypothetical protein
MGASIQCHFVQYLAHFFAVVSQQVWLADRGYLKRLLNNARIARFLEKSHRDILDEFREIVAL